jgi:hypothetical protein
VKQWTFTVAELDRVVKFLHNLNELSKGYGVVLDSYSDQFLALADDKGADAETVLQALYSDEAEQYVLAVVSV